PTWYDWREPTRYGSRTDRFEVVMVGPKAVDITAGVRAKRSLSRLGFPKQENTNASITRARSSTALDDGWNGATAQGGRRNAGAIAKTEAAAEGPLLLADAVRPHGGRPAL